MANNNRTVPVKPISEIEVKAEVSENDKILILDSESEEARLASKEELKGDTGARINTAEFSGNDIVFGETDGNTVVLADAKTTLKGDGASVTVGTTTTGVPGTDANVENTGTTTDAIFNFTIPRGDKGEPGTDAWQYMTQAEYDDLPASKLTDGVSRAIYDTAQHTFKTLLRSTDNILHYNNDDELYADLQFESGLTPTSPFPAGVSIGNVVSTDGWDTGGLLLNAKTNEGDYMRWLYGTDGKLYFDGGTGVFKTIATTDDITSALSTLSNSLSTVAFSGKSSDLDNDAGFNSVPVMTQAQYDEQTGAASDDKRYFIYEEY